MTTVSQLITDAYRESNLIAVNSSPTSPEQTEALRLLNRVVKSLFGNEMGDPLDTIPLGKGNTQTPSNVPFYMDDMLDYYVPKNTLLQCNLETPVTVRLDPSPQDGSRLHVVDASGNFATNSLTIYGNGRLIENSTNITVSINGLSRQWFYRNDLGTWVRLSDLELSDESPFPEEFDDLLIGQLSLRIAPRQGVSLSEATGATLQRLEKKFRAKYKQSQEVPSEHALTRLPSRKLYGFSGTTNAFERGLPKW